MAWRQVRGGPPGQRHQPSPLTGTTPADLRIRKRSQVRSLVNERTLIWPRTCGHQASTCGHFRVRLKLGIAAAVEANRCHYDSVAQVEADESAFLETAADRKLVPLGRVAHVLQGVVELIGPEVVDVVERGSAAQHCPGCCRPVMLRAVVVLDAHPAEQRMLMVSHVASSIDVR